jgi:hypothetical protein
MIKFLFLALVLTACGDPSYQDQVINQPASNALVPANPINYPVVCDGEVCVQLKD